MRRVDATSRVLYRAARGDDLMDIEDLMARAIRVSWPIFYGSAATELFLRNCCMLSAETLADGRMIVAEADGQVVASAGWRRAEPRAAAPKGAPAARLVSLRAVFVDPRWQGRGIARAILAMAEADAVAVSDADLVTATVAMPAVALHLAQGYSVRGPVTIEPHRGLAIRCARMTKRRRALTLAA